MPQHPFKPYERKTAQGKFIAVLAEGASVATSCRKARVSRRSVYRWRKEDDQFAEAWQQGADLIEDEMLRRGKDGWEEPVFYRGVQCGTVRRYSDLLLIVSHKMRRPEAHRAYSDTTMRGPNNGPVQIEDPRQWIFEQLAETGKRLGVGKDHAPA